MKKMVLASSAFLALAACGGGGGSSTPSPTASPAPSPTATPTPTPAPTPTPSPTPTPPPAEPTARVVAASTGPSDWKFFPSFPPSFDDRLAFGFGSREGQYAPGFDGAFAMGSFLADGIGQDEDLSGRHKIASFVDPNTTMRVRVASLPEARVVSPLTALLVSGPSPDKLKRQLGVTENVFRLRTIDPDLNTFDPIAELQNDNPDIVIDAERLLAANLRALALCSALSDFCLPITGTGFFEDEQVQMALAGAPDQFLFNDNVAMSGVVANTRRFRGTSPEVQSAAAHLINAYAAAVALRIDRPEFAAKFLMGIQGYLVPRVRELSDTNSSALAMAALAVNSQNILDDIERFEESLTADLEALFFPAPDYYETSVNTPIVLDDSLNSDTAPDRSPRANDVIASSRVGGSFLSSAGAVTGVEVPAINAGEVAATLRANGDIELVPALGFTGLTYVDYTTRHEDGETGRARIFLRVLP